VARARIGLSRPTVWRWQQHFAEAGVEGLLRDKTRKPGKAPIAADKAAQLVALTPAFARAGFAPKRRIRRPIGPSGIRSAGGGNAMLAWLRDLT
jgi:hypothetical protein